MTATDAEYRARSCGGADRRGNALNRRRRKEWLLREFGDGSTAPCFSCRRPLTYDTVTVDRIVPGERGGTYRRGNIRPACLPCNSGAQGSAEWWRRFYERTERELDAELGPDPYAAERVGRPL